MTNLIFDKNGKLIPQKIKFNVKHNELDEGVIDKIEGINGNSKKIMKYHEKEDTEMAKGEDWVKRKAMANGCVEIVYVETDSKGVYVVKETIYPNGLIKERKKDVILDFPIEIIEMSTIKDLNSPYGEYGQCIYRININGKEYKKTIKRTRSLIQKRVVKQPFYTKYGFKFKDYINMALRGQEKKLERENNG